MKRLVVFLGFMLVAGCAGENGAAPTTQVGDPNLMKLECDHYVFFVNRDGASSKEDLIAFFHSIYSSTGFTNIGIGPTNADSKGSIMVTATALAGRKNERSDGLAKISALNGVTGSCDVPVGPAN
jgi:hypothetical protein